MHHKDERRRGQNFGAYIFFQMKTLDAVKACKLLLYRKIGKHFKRRYCFDCKAVCIFKLDIDLPMLMTQLFSLYVSVSELFRKISLIFQKFKRKRYLYDEILG
jgi:hypothetical protein